MTVVLVWIAVIGLLFVILSGPDYRLGYAAITVAALMVWTLLMVVV